MEREVAVRKDRQTTQMRMAVAASRAKWTMVGLLLLLMVLMVLQLVRLVLCFVVGLVCVPSPLPAIVSM